MADTGANETTVQPAQATQAPQTMIIEESDELKAMRAKLVADLQADIDKLKVERKSIKKHNLTRDFTDNEKQRLKEIRRQILLHYKRLQYYRDHRDLVMRKKYIENPEYRQHKLEYAIKKYNEKKTVAEGVSS